MTYDDFGSYYDIRCCQGKHNELSEYLEKLVDIEARLAKIDYKIKNLNGKEQENERCELKKLQDIKLELEDNFKLTILEFKFKYNFHFRLDDEDFSYFLYLYMSCLTFGFYPEILSMSMYYFFTHCYINYINYNVFLNYYMKSYIKKYHGMHDINKTEELLKQCYGLGRNFMSYSVKHNYSLDNYLKDSWINSGMYNEPPGAALNCGDFVKFMI